MGVSVAGMQFLIVSLSNISLFLYTFYDILFDSIIFVNYFGLILFQELFFKKYFGLLFKMFL